jgi:hypothetical protein
MLIHPNRVLYTLPAKETFLFLLAPLLSRPAVMDLAAADLLLALTLVPPAGGASSSPLFQVRF